MILLSSAAECLLTANKASGYMCHFCTKEHTMGGDKDYINKSVLRPTNETYSFEVVPSVQYYKFPPSYQSKKLYDNRVKVFLAH